MNKKLLSIIFSALLLSVAVLNAQNTRNCGTMQYYENQIKSNPGLLKNREKIEQFTERFAQQHPDFKNSSGTINIPVVFHILYSTAAQNISNARIQAQLDEMNADFAGTANNVGSTPAVFTPLIANSGIQFCYAQRDPNGCTTDGIIRKATTVTNWGFNDNMKFDASGGDDAWPASDYLNIWVCNLGAGLLGFATFPGGAANVDGVVLLYSCVGGPASPGTATPYHLGRTGSHEVGHWLNLFHINGDSNCGNDQVGDTPTQDQLHFGCPTHPYHVNVCSGSTNGEMFMNYMDYTDDACMTMFSNGQSTRMNACLQGVRSSILTSQGCVAPSLFADDAGIDNIIVPNGPICSATIDPVVSLKNYGTNALTSAIINYQVDAGPINTYNWAGNIASCAASVTVTLPNLAVSAGVHTFNAYTSNPNGVTDPNAANNTSNSNFSSGAAGVALPQQQGFESVTFPPANWVLTNPDASYTWERTTQAAKSGTASVYMNNFDYAANGEIDDLDMLPVDLTTASNPELSFWVAYRLYTDTNDNPNFSDTLEVMVSTDCGATFTSVYKKFSVALTTAVPYFSTALFIPTAAQWRKEIISLGAFAAAGNLIVRFHHTTDYENNMYIDDINIDQATGISSILADPSFTVYPVPANGIVNVQWGSVINTDVSVTITNSIGETVLKNEVKNYSGFVMPFDLSNHANGIYFIEAVSGNKIINQKIVLEK